MTRPPIPVRQGGSIVPAQGSSRVGGMIGLVDASTLESASVAILNYYALANQVPQDEFDKVVFRGVPVGDIDDPGQIIHSVDFSTMITDMTFSMSTDMVTQLTLAVEDPGLTWYKSGIFYEGGHVTYRNVDFVIATTNVNGGGSGLGGVTVSARSANVQKLKNRQGPLSIQNSLVSDFVVTECAAEGISCVVQPTAIRTTVQRQVKNETQQYSLDETPSTWTTFQAYAESEGYVLFECYGIIFFCKPSWLYTEMFNAGNKVMTNVGIFWNSTHSETGGKSRWGQSDPNFNGLKDVINTGVQVRDDMLWVQAMEVPDVTVSYDQQQGPAWTVTCQVDLQNSHRFFLGQRLVLRGMGPFNEATALLVSSIDYSIAGKGPATITATSPYDPKPPNDTSVAGGFGTNPISNVIAGLHMPPGRYGGQPLNGTQLANAVEIYRCGYDMKVNHTQLVAALITGYTESSFHRYYNPQVPGSRNVPNDGPPPPFGAPFSDHSVGVFQQRDSWGTVADRMDTYKAAGKFYRRARDKAPRETDPAQLAQTVQVSAFPGRYRQYIPMALALISRMRDAAQSALPTSVNGWTPGHPIGTKRAYDFVNIALKMVGKTYIYGYNPPNLTDVPRAFDCSLLVQWAAYQVGVKFPRDTYSQYPFCQTHGTMISVAEGLRTRGAVFFKTGLGHTGISLGDGRTVEAYDTGIGVIINSPSKYGFHWGYAARIPGMHY